MRIAIASEAIGAGLPEIGFFMVASFKSNCSTLRCSLGRGMIAGLMPLIFSSEAIQCMWSRASCRLQNFHRKRLIRG